MANARTFALQRGGLIRRLDWWFNHPRYELLHARLDEAPMATPTLKKILTSIASGATPRRDDTSFYTNEGIKFLRILNIADGEILNQDLKYITDAVHSGELGRSQLETSDVLMTITGRVGSAAVVRREHLPANINQHIVRLRINEELCRPEFFSEWLNSPTGLELSNRSISGGTRDALDYGAVRDIRIPLPNSLADQDRLLATMDAARKERRAKLTEANLLLAGLDNFLLTALDFTPASNSDRKVFAISTSMAREYFRLNADYFHPERTLTLRAMNLASQVSQCAKLAEMVSFVRKKIGAPGPNYLSLAHVQSNTGELVSAHKNTTGACSVYQNGDVLFARLRPYLNKVYRAEMDGCCSPEFHVLRVNDNKKLLPDYLAAILRCSVTLAQTRHMMTGNTHPRLSNDDVTNLVIPIPKNIAVQHTIVAEIRSRREDAQHLRTQAAAEWQAAKHWFEEQLLSTS